MTMKLYWHPFSIFPRRVQIALREKGIVCDEVVVDLPGGALRSAEFLRLNPFGQVPVLEDGATVVAESIAILEYLEERHPSPALLPTDPGQRAQARQLMLWSGDYLAPAWKAWIAPRFDPSITPDHPSVHQAHHDLATHLDVLAARLAGAPWLVGDYSLADVCYAPFITTVDLIGLADLLDQRPSVRAWEQRLQNRPAVKSTMRNFG
jgi:glutathione S-transferase